MLLFSPAGGATIGQIYLAKRDRGWCVYNHTPYNNIHYVVMNLRTDPLQQHFRRE